MHIPEFLAQLVGLAPVILSVSIFVNCQFAWWTLKYSLSSALAGWVGTIRHALVALPTFQFQT